jgi:hypothetical protein
VSNSGAKAALQGYRLQALYILHLVLSSTDPKKVFHPEGKEDVDTYLNGELSQSIQVKSHTGNLTYSDFNPASVDSFFHRSLESLANTNASVEVVTYGPVGPELAQAWRSTGKERDSLRNKFLMDGYDQAEFEVIVEKIKWKSVSEEQLESEIFTILSSSLAGGEPSRAFELLTCWIYQASENSQRFSRQEIVNKIAKVGRYLEQRAAHHDEWFASINPIIETDLNAVDREAIHSDFYEGVSVGYIHIALGLDVIRTEKLIAIEDAFQQEKQVVIVHGASGQGKSALAYRFLHDNVPSDWRFSISYVDGRKHAAKIALAISEHHDAFGAPVYIYLDVRPSDVEWPELVKKLIEKNNIKILVTIREEDLARASIPQQELRFPSLIELTFCESEAEPIFDSLVKRGASHSYPSFNEAWARFGGHGPLMEFVFLLTQSESLKERLKNQVHRLQEEVRKGDISLEELHLLRVCAVATAYEAQVDVKEVCQLIALNEPVATIRMFNHEYLIRLSSDGRKIVCLHPLRSEILANELCDDVFYPWSDAAKVALKTISEDCLEGFLLYAFSRYSVQSGDIVKYLMDNQPQTWTGVAGVARAVLWLGIREYVSENIHLIEQAQQMLGKGWYMVMHFDLTGEMHTAETGLLDLFGKENPALADRCQKLRDEQTPTINVYKYLKRWLEASGGFLPPVNPMDWQAVTELTYWIKFLEIENSNYVSSLLSLNLDWALANLPLRALCELIYSLKKFSKSIRDSLVRPIHQDVVDRYKEEYLVINIVVDDDNISTHYIIDEELLSENSGSTGSSSSDLFHEETLKRVDLLALIFPEYKSYGAQGYGHRFRIIPNEYDPTQKGHMDAKYLLPSWVSEVNPTFLNIVEWDLRPATWADYAEETLKVRREIYFEFKILMRGLVAYFKKKRAVNLVNKIDVNSWESVKKISERYPLLPRLAVDEWGKVSETKNSDTHQQSGKVGLPTPLAVAATIDKYRSLLGPIGEYLSACRNFLSQALPIIAVNSLTSRVSDPEQVKGILAELKDLGIQNGSSHISAINLADAKRALAETQYSYQNIIGQLSDYPKLNVLEKDEKRLFESLNPLWFQFLYFPEKTINYAEARCKVQFENVLNELKERINQVFENDNTEHYCSHLKSSLLHDNKQALWISVDVSEHMDLIEEGDFIKQVFGTAFSSIDFNSYEYHALSFLFESVVIIPHIANSVFSTNAVCISLNILVGKDENEPFNAFLYGCELEEEVIMALGFEVSKTPALHFAADINKSIAQLFVLSEHLSDMTNIPDGIDEHGISVFETYCSRKNAKLQTVMDSFGKLIEDSDIVSYCESKNNPDLSDTVSFICDEIQDAMPECDEDGVFILNQEAMLDWASRLTESTFKIGLAQWYILKYEVDSMRSGPASLSS